LSPILPFSSFIYSAVRVHAQAIIHSRLEAFPGLLPPLITDHFALIQNNRPAANRKHPLEVMRRYDYDTTFGAVIT
jgi:hypothetical protein